MKKNWIIVPVIALMVSTGCNKELELEPKDALSTQTALSTIGGINAAVVGMYANMRNVDYYGRSLFVYGDLSSDNVYLAKTNSNRYISTFQRNYAAVDADILNMWTQIYSTISRANNVINAVDNVTAEAGEKDLAKGQALFVRGLAYFDLVRIFAKPYNQGNGTQPGVPVVLTSDVTAKPGRNTVAEVYTQIIEDLNNAKTLLASTSATTKVTATKYAASALLSRVYLYKGDNTNAISEANIVTSAADLKLTPAGDLATFYTTVENEEEIFSLRFLTTESLGSDNLGNIYLKPGYGDIRVSPDLVAVFDKNKDARYTDFIKPFSTSAAEFQNNKFTGQEGSLGLYSPKILRLAEVVLNRAEAHAKAGQSAEALADLNEIRTSRGLTAAGNLSGDALIGAILEERRREFMFEGQRYFDLIRNSLPVARNYCNQPTEVQTPSCTLNADDPKAIAPIPQAEIDANPGLKGQQNQGY